MGSMEGSAGIAENDRDENTTHQFLNQLEGPRKIQVWFDSFSSISQISRLMRIYIIIIFLTNFKVTYETMDTTKS
jgi:hypothetical protein